MRHYFNVSSTLRYITSILSAYAAGFVGSLFMRTGWDTWYETLVKPPFAPASSIFFPVWMVLYFLIGLSLGFLWSHTDLWHPWVGNFFVALAFNAAWIMFFFGLHVILIALIDLVCLVLITTVLILGAMEIESRAGYLLLPYLAWLLFAFYFNAGIWFLN